MENKYLEKVAGLVGAALGAGSAFRASKERDSAVGRGVAGALVGHGVETLGDKVIRHGAKNLSNLLMAGKARPAHLAAFGVGALGAGAASAAGAMIAGRGAGKLYDKAKEKMTGK